MEIVARVLLAILIVFLLPVAAHALWWVTRDDLAPDWGSADWSSAKLLPPPSAKPEALVYIYAARTGGWPPDGRWFSNAPELVVAIEDEAAEKLVPRVRAAIRSYPHGEWGNYRA